MSDKNTEFIDNESSEIGIKKEELSQLIDNYYKKIPISLQDFPDAQIKCLELLSSAEQCLISPVDRKKIIDARRILTQIEIEMNRSQNAKMSFYIVIAIVYFFAATIGIAMIFGIINTGETAKEFNAHLLMGVPLPIWIWGGIGSMTSMLLRAGYVPFSSRSEALRWLFSRPIVGVIMGVMTYLMVIAGLLVFAGTSNTQTPELLWIMAFVGSFSDNLSINLLQRILGKFQSKELMIEESDTNENKSNINKDANSSKS